MNLIPTFIPNSEWMPWYGVRTRANHERTAATVLEAKGYEQYLPSYKVRRRWSDRIVETILPLFPGYVFCRFDELGRQPAEYFKQTALPCSDAVAAIARRAVELAAAG